MKTNILEAAHSYFTKDEKKASKLAYKNSLKNNSLHYQQRNELMANFFKSAFPNWNIKFSLLTD